LNEGVQTPNMTTQPLNSMATNLMLL